MKCAKMARNSMAPSYRTIHNEPHQATIIMFFSRKQPFLEGSHKVGEPGVIIITATTELYKRRKFFDMAEGMGFAFAFSYLPMHAGDTVSS